MCGINFESQNTRRPLGVFKKIEFWVMIIGLLSFGYSIVNSERTFEAQKKQFRIQHKADSSNLALAILQANVSSRPFASIDIKSFNLNSDEIVLQSNLTNKGPVPIVIDSLTIKLSEPNSGRHNHLISVLVGQKENCPDVYMSYGLNLKQDRQIVTLKLYYRSVFDDKTEYFTEKSLMSDIKRNSMVLLSRSTGKIKI